ncbi:Rieske (2Fe-2S) protein [Spongiactinospora sp. TRM90649]|uniref:Rieske (2Fe-2S) protein n=1 Tax=Spongiactinospora sp. TRM90649 TaxID=3031114 RepID=UPI0023F636E7|nr:Rieske (2Fe-2S) protein [Spongiactinospora sp. TRM90649]MDF5759212.1 Rieske (2Fe-2S) protein [Spongiactinospora sp. TRM90649]
MSDVTRGADTAGPGARAQDPTRRLLMLGAGGAGLAVALTACSAYGDPGGATGATTEPQSSAPQESKSGESGGGSGGFAKTADIPEGGGAVFKNENVVVVQPQAGEFKAFSATCTHNGCTVADVSDGLINCPCHGSKFKIADGSVAGGPASKPLPEKQIKVDGESISLA